MEPGHDLYEAKVEFLRSVAQLIESQAKIQAFLLILRLNVVYSTNKQAQIEQLEADAASVSNKIFAGLNLLLNQ